ncbi:MAG TPA: phage minor head protein [Anaerolineae bacterium]|nr:phage minor head protein [Anaerolineae bacterium]
MPDFNNRTDWEDKLSRQLARLQQRELTRLIEALGEPPSLDNLHPEFWNEFSTTLRGELIPTLERIFLDGAEQTLGTTSIGVDWALINQAAAQWARSYGYDLVQDITTNTRTALQEKLPAYFEQGQTIGQLRESLQPLFGPVRAELIATTEVTRAAVQGELETARQISQAGVQMVAIWQTNNDDFVCPICAPLNQKRYGDGWTVPPPAHPRCRCWISHEFS